ncbi:AEC family transporter [Methylosoma difficile]
MHTTLIQMSLLMACGACWRLFKPAGLSAEQTRLVLTTVVYYLLLPALVLNVLWRADIGLQSFQYTFLGMSCVLMGLLSMWLVGRLLRLKNNRLGATMLAAAFPNTTYLGLPVLEQSFGPWTRSVVIQLDLFATTPLLFTLGVILMRHFGDASAQNDKPVLAYLNAPPFWAAAVAVTLNLSGVAEPDWLEGLLQTLSSGVVLLMLFSLGLALTWQSVTLKNLPYVIPVIAIKMLLMPLLALFLVGHLSLQDNYKAAAVLDLAMPSMVLGIVFCDRYHLDSALYAMTVTVTTALSLISLPLWYALLTGQ